MQFMELPATREDIVIYNNDNKANIYAGYTLQQVKTAVINVCPVPYALIFTIKNVYSYKKEKKGQQFFTFKVSNIISK